MTGRMKEGEGKDTYKRCDLLVSNPKTDSQQNPPPLFFCFVFVGPVLTVIVFSPLISQLSLARQERIYGLGLMACCCVGGNN